MNDGQALYRAICENPEEDTPRLVYADWLEEQGESEYARYIRTSISLFRNPPDEASFEHVLKWGERERWCWEYEIINKHRLVRDVVKIDDEFMRYPEDYPLASYCNERRFVFERGFIQSVEYRTEDIFLPGMWNVGPREGTYFTLLAERLVRETPITCLMLRNVTPFPWPTGVQRGTRSRPARALYKYRWTSTSEWGEEQVNLLDGEWVIDGALPQWLFDRMWYSRRIDTVHKITVMSQSQLSTRYIEFDRLEQANEALGTVLCWDIRDVVYGSKKNG